MRTVNLSPEMKSINLRSLKNHRGGKCIGPWVPENFHVRVYFSFTEGRHYFIAMFTEGRQSKKHCFIAMFTEGRQTKKHCFLAMFMKVDKPRKIVSEPCLLKIDKPGNIVS